MFNPVKGRFRPGILLAILFLHVVAVTAACMMGHISTTAWTLAGVLYAVSSLGVTVGYHRYFTHGAFRCTEPLKYALAIAGGLAAEGPLSQWCSDHRQHHFQADVPYDPHSPDAYLKDRGHSRFYNRVKGFFWAHVGWLFFETLRPVGYHPSVPAQDEAVVAWQHRAYWYIVVTGFAVPMLVAGWQGLLLAGFIRVVVHLNVTWMVNSVCHLWGTRPLGPDGKVWKMDQSRNNLLVALLGMGEGWHGNHHVKPNSAQLGYRWYQWDPGKWLIAVLVSVGLASDMRRFSPV